MYIAHVTYTCSTRDCRRHVERFEKDVACKANLPSDSTKATLEVCLRPKLHCLPAVCNNDDTAYRELHFTMPLTDPPLRGDAQTPCLVEWQIWFSENSVLSIVICRTNRRAVWTRFESVKVRVSSEILGHSYCALNLSRMRHERK